jgi:nucleoid-associated protein YgaU
MLTGERSMGRETKILLALLATLAGVFLGVLSMKLLVPRPPVGAGPDVHLDLASTGENELVEPPSLSPPTPGPAAEEPAFVAAEPPPPLHRYAESEPAIETVDLLSYPPAPTAPLAAPSDAASAEMPPTAALEPNEPVSPPATTPRRDPFVSPAGLEMAAPQSLPPTDSAPAAVAYVANPGDSWWDLAERAYGDGRLYRALFAWNRVIDPRISLTPGTRLEIPPRPKLEAAWPKLMPAE